MKAVSEWKTTAIGAITALLSILVAFGVFSTSESTEIKGYFNGLIEHGEALWGIIAGLVLIFKAKWHKA